MGVITYPCWGLKLNHVSKRGPCWHTLMCWMEMELLSWLRLLFSIFGLMYWMCMVLYKSDIHYWVRNGVMNMIITYLLGRYQSTKFMFKSMFIKNNLLTWLLCGWWPWWQKSEAMVEHIVTAKRKQSLTNAKDVNLLFHMWFVLDILSVICG